MKRTPVFLLIGVVLLIALTACDMNLWLSSGAIEVDKTAATAAVTSIKTSSNAVGDDDKLVPLDDEIRQQIIADLGKAIGSPEQKKHVLEELAKPAALAVDKAAKEVLDAAKHDVIEAVKDLKDPQKEAILALLPTIPENTVLTEADVLNIQLINSMASTVIKIVEDADGDEEISPEAYMPLIKEALDIVDIVKSTASSASIDMLANVDIAALMKQFMPGGAT